VAAVRHLGFVASVFEVWTTHDEYLVVSIVVHNLAGIDAAISALRLKMPTDAPRWGFGGKNGETETFCSLSGTDDIRIKQRKNWSCGFNSRREQNFESQKNTNHARVIFHLFAQTPHLGDRFRFGMRGDIADVITHDKFLLIGSGVSGF